MDVNLFNIRCVCHGLNLIKVNPVKSLEKASDQINMIQDDEIIKVHGQENNIEDFSELNCNINEFNTREFVNNISSYFNYSYKRHEDYCHFSKNT